MAKMSSVNKNQNRMRMITRDAKKRATLKAVVQDRDAAPEDRFAATLKLAEMPRNGAKTRYRNRCALTGRPRSFHGKFNLSRISLRKLASEGQLPGVVKSSW